MNRRHIGLSAGVIALGLVPAAGALMALTTVTSPAADPSDQLRGVLAARVTELLEHATPVEHHDHGHAFAAQDGKIICAVDPFGTDPADARTESEVRWVYARHLCAVTGAGRTWSTAVRASGPLAVHFGATPEIHVPASGTGYPDRVAKLIPQPLRTKALAPFTDTTALDAARARFERAVS